MVGMAPGMARHGTPLLFGCGAEMSCDLRQGGRGVSRAWHACHLSLALAAGACLGGAGALLLLDCYDGSCHASMCALWHSEFAACSNYKQDESQTACSPGRGTRIPTSLLKRFTDRAYWRCRWSGSYQCMCLRRKAQYHTSTRSTYMRYHLLR